MIFSLTKNQVGGYALNVASNHVTKADTAPESFSGIFMPVIYGGSARNSLRVITPRFFGSVLRLPPPIGLLKSSLVGVLKRFTKGALIMNAISAPAALTAEKSVKTYSEMTAAELFSEQKRLFRIAQNEPNDKLSCAICNVGCELSALIAGTPATSNDDVRAKLLFMLNFYVDYMDTKEVMPVDWWFFEAVKTTLQFLKGENNGLDESTNR